MSKEDMVEFLIYLRSRCIAGNTGRDDDDRRKTIRIIDTFLTKWGIPPTGPTA